MGQTRNGQHGGGGVITVNEYNNIGGRIKNNYHKLYWLTRPSRLAAPILPCFVILKWFTMEFSRYLHVRFSTVRCSYDLILKIRLTFYLLKQSV